MSPPGAAEAMGYIGMNSDYGGMQGVSVFYLKTSLKHNSVRAMTGINHYRIIICTTVF